MIAKKGSGGEMLAFFMFIFILGIVAASVSWGVRNYFSGEYDFRQDEAKLLNVAVVECLNDNDFFSLGFDFYSACKIDKNIQDLFVLVKQGDKEFLIGVRDFEMQCQLAGKNYNYPRCFSSKTTRAGVEYEIITGSNHLREKMQ